MFLFSVVTDRGLTSDVAPENLVKTTLEVVFIEKTRI